MGRAAGGDRQLSAEICLSRLLGSARQQKWPRAQKLGTRQGLRQEIVGRKPGARGIPQHRPGDERPGELDRKSVESGKSVSVRVDLGGRRFIKKKKKEQIQVK